MIFTLMPRDFDSRFETVSTFVVFEGKILLLHRHPEKPQGGTWSTPAGKRGSDEQQLEAMMRELREETGISANEQEFKFFATIFVRYEDFDFTYHMYSLCVAEIPVIILHNSEHTEFAWVSPVDALKMNLIEDLDGCIRLYFNGSLKEAISA